MSDNEDKTIDNRKVYPITLIWGALEDERKVPVVLDHKVQVIEAFLLFIIYKAIEYLRRHTPTTRNKGAYDSFIHRYGYTLFTFAQYLRSKSIKWQDIDDSRIVEFKRFQNDLTKSKPNSLIPETVNDSVNYKLRIIYEFYWWAQHIQNLVENSIGHNIDAPITSNISKYKDDPTSFKKDRTAMRTVYPLCEYVTAEIGRNRRQHYSSDIEITNLHRIFRQKCNILTAERNVLMVDIIECIGWREGSVASLTTKQFSKEVIDKALKDHNNIIKVTPEHQKLGYMVQYDALIQLAIRIKRFITENRLEMLIGIGKVEKEAKATYNDDNLFISSTTGQPLTAKTISRIISDAFKSIGVVGERAGPHSIRRKYGKDKSSELHEVRKRNGLTLDPKDVIFDLSTLLGQSSLTAQNAYTADRRDIYNESIESKLHGKIAELQSEVTSLRLSNHRKDVCIINLEKRVAELESENRTLLSKFY